MPYRLVVFQPPPRRMTFPSIVPDSKGCPVGPKTLTSMPLFAAGSVHRLFWTRTFLPPATRNELAHQGATVVLFKIFVPSIWLFVPLGPLSEYVAIPSSPAPRTKLFCAVRFRPRLSGPGVLPLFRLIPSAQLSATRLSWIVPLVPVTHCASQCRTQTLSISLPPPPLPAIPYSPPLLPPLPLYMPTL